MYVVIFSSSHVVSRDRTGRLWSLLVVSVANHCGRERVVHMNSAMFTVYIHTNMRLPPYSFYFHTHLQCYMTWSVLMGLKTQQNKYTQTLLVCVEGRKTHQYKYT